MGTFQEDNEWQRHMRDTVLVPQFYEARLKGRFLLLDGDDVLATYIQRVHGADTIAIMPSGKLVSIEEKIVRLRRDGKQHDAFFIETESCTLVGKEKPGWMTYSQADFMLYCMETATAGLDCHLFEMGFFKEWFWLNEQTFPLHQNTEEQQGSSARGRLVALDDLPPEVKHFRLSMVPAGEFTGGKRQ